MTIKVLVVDDEPDVQQLILQHFNVHIQKKQFEFVFAVTGIEALQKFEQNPGINILMTDINMSGMDGLTLISKITKQNPKVKCIVISAYSDQENMRSAMRKGACDFITKPVDYDELGKVITEIGEELLT